MLIKHSIQYLIARIFPAVINLLALTIYTHLLTPAEYGQYALIISGVGFANTLVFWWLRLGLVRFYPQYLERQGDFLSSILRGFFYAGLVSFVLWVVILTFVDQALRPFVWIALVLLLAMAWVELNLELIRSRLEPAYFGRISFIRSGCALLLGVVLIYTGMSALGAVLGAMFSYLLIALWESVRSWRKVDVLAFDNGFLRELFKYGLPLAGVFGMEYIVSSSDRFMLGWLLGSSEVGVYSAAYDLTNQSLTMLISVVYLAGYPLIVKVSEKGDQSVLSDLLSRYLSALLGTGLPLSILVCVFSSDISHTFLGRDFHDDAVSIIPWISVATLFSCLKYYYMDIPFHLTKRTLRQLLMMIFPALLNIILNLMLIPNYGGEGAAYATLISYMAAVVLSWGMGRHEHAMPLFNRNISLIVCSSAIMFVVALLFIPENSQQHTVLWVFQAMLLFLTYALVAFLCNVSGIRVELVPKMKAWLANGWG